MQVNLCMRKGSYIDSAGVVKNTTRFYIQIGKSSRLIQIAPVYFNRKDGQRDTSYASKKYAMEMVSDELEPFDATKNSVPPVDEAPLGEGDIPDDLA